MNTSEFLDFDDILSHEKEELILGEFTLSRVLSVKITDKKEKVYDLVVEGNRNYVVSTLGLVHNGGKRAGAGTIALPIWHNDILDFLDMQTEHGDLRAKAYDVFPQLTVPDLFMRRDQEQGRWITFCPFEVKNKLGIDMRGLYGKEFEEAYLKIEAAVDANRLKVFRIFKSAREITKIFMKTQFETGLPYIAFVDEINRVNPNKSEGYIPSVNLCTESFSNVVADELGHVCNLASVNAGSIETFEELARISGISCRVLDYGISLTNAPDPITKAHNNKYRTIGIGVMGLHDYLARERYTYKNLDLISKISECIEYNAAVESTILAKKYGSFEAFGNSEWKNGGMTSLFKSRSSGEYDWDALQKLIDENGMRNSQLTSPAPTTSTSISSDASASFLPVYDAFFSEDNNNGTMKVSARFLTQNPIGYGKNFAKFEAKEIIDICSAYQKFVDTGCSMELILDQNKETFKAKDLYDAIHYAWEQKLKSIYYIRSIKKNEKLEKQESDCIACAG